MDVQENITLIDYEDRWLDDLILMWRESFEHGVGIVDPHPLEEQRRCFLENILPYNAVKLAVEEDQLLGFIAASRKSVSQLYVRVGLHRRGIGTLMLNWAKQQYRGNLWLHTFQQNRVARAFYERQGFVELERGFEEMWQLADIKFGWQRQATSK